MSKSRYYLYARNMRMCASPYTCTCKQPKEAHTVRNCKLGRQGGTRHSPAMHVQLMHSSAVHALPTWDRRPLIGAGTGLARIGEGLLGGLVELTAPPTHRAKQGRARQGVTDLIPSRSPNQAVVRFEDLRDHTEIWVEKSYCILWLFS